MKKAGWLKYALHAAVLIGLIAAGTVGNADHAPKVTLDQAAAVLSLWWTGNFPAAVVGEAAR